MFDDQLMKTLEFCERPMELQSLQYESYSVLSCFHASAKRFDLCQPAQADISRTFLHEVNIHLVNGLFYHMIKRFFGQD